MFLHTKALIASLDCQNFKQKNPNFRSKNYDVCMEGISVPENSHPRHCNFHQFYESSKHASNSSRVANDISISEESKNEEDKCLHEQKVLKKQLVPDKTSSSQQDGDETEKGENNKFSFRLDVVKKTIIRKIKKFYRVSFKEFYDYPKYRRQTIQKQSTNTFIQAKRFLIQKFGNNTPMNLEMYLVAIIDVKKKYEHPENG